MDGRTDGWIEGFYGLRILKHNITSPVGYESSAISDTTAKPPSYFSFGTGFT